MATNKRLVRPLRGRWLGGVCAGIADYFGLSRDAVRIAAVLSCLLPGPQYIAYIIGWLLIPSER
ncbi:MAG: PspC domain-containing protein [Actinomycetaceae bacterium]|nr:PspC domain-containing protein [Actinomycetaceae bacterium]MDU0971125.1 PspC domain-containing protein [Actinomycetaceae bacterium]